VNMPKRLHKKAIFFTFVAIILLSALVFSFSIYTRYRMRTRGLVIETRVNTMNSFMRDIDKDIIRGGFISSHRSILAMVEYVSANGVYIDNVEDRFEEVFLNGTINRSPQALMSDTTFNDWISRMQSQGGKINLELDFNIKDIVINHSDPWNIGIYLDTEIYVSDVTDIAVWNVTRTIKTVVPIEGFEDPVYAVNTDAKVLNIVNKTPFTDFVTGNNDTSNLQQHTSNSYYVAWSTAPSFLMRIEGNISASPYGIESLINLQKMIDQGIEVEERSVVDHIYWSNKSINSYHIDKMPSWFMMDDENNPDENMTHLELYEVESLIS
jgi:hypothetical protein